MSTKLSFLILCASVTFILLMCVTGVVIVIVLPKDTNYEAAKAKEAGLESSKVETGTGVFCLNDVPEGAIFNRTDLIECKMDQCDMMKDIVTACDIPSGRKAKYAMKAGEQVCQHNLEPITTVVVCVKALAKGVVISNTDLQENELPENAATPDDLVGGRETKSFLHAGQFISTNDLVPKD
jgi:Flp pilus assembly protein CpaB